MKKYIRKHKKDEKRILKLMYKKGFFKVLHLDFSDLCWEYSMEGKMLRRRRGKSKYSYNELLPELHVWTQDYYGEGDSRSVVECFREYLWYSQSEEQDESGFPNEKSKNNSELIAYLKTLPTKNNNSKLNPLLKVANEY